MSAQASGNNILLGILNFETFNEVYLTHVRPSFHFYTAWNRQKNFRFLTFSRGIETKHWVKMG